MTYPKWFPPWLMGGSHSNESKIWCIQCPHNRIMCTKIYLVNCLFEKRQIRPFRQQKSCSHIYVDSIFEKIRKESFTSNLKLSLLAHPQSEQVKNLICKRNWHFPYSNAFSSQTSQQTRKSNKKDNSTITYSRQTNYYFFL